jgi:hypothetical protein
MLELKACCVVADREAFPASEIIDLTGGRSDYLARRKPIDNSVLAMYVLDNIRL